MLEANREKLNSFQMNYLEIFEKLQKGIPVTDTTRFFNDQNTIDNRIQSVIFLPIIIDSILWAYIFCINKDDYEWKAKDLSDLMELSYKITSALSRKKQILMLMKDEEHYTFLIENVTDVVVRVDENTVVKDIRGYVTKLSGYSSEDIVGKSLL